MKIGIINRTSEAKTASAIARVEELANLELTDSIIGVLGKNETEKTVAQILTTLENRGDIDGSGLRSEVSITGFNFGESNTVSVGTTEETKTKNLTANFISPEIEGAYYVLIEGKKYPISKINGRIKIEKTEIQSNDNTSAKISNVVSNDTDIATIEKTGDKQITITGKARGNTTITVQSTGLPDVTLNVNVKGSTTLTINTDNTANCSVSPTSVTALEGEEVQLTAAPASGKKLKGWYTNNELKSTDNPYKYKIPDGTNGTTYATSITITAQFEDRTSEIEEGRNPERYGGYVRYNVDLGIDGNFDDVDDGIDDDWRIFYEDSQNVYIIAADSVPISKINSIIDGDNDESSIFKIGAQTYSTYDIFWESDSSLMCQTYKDGTILGETNGAADIFTNRPNGTAYLTERGLLKFWKDAMERNDSEITINNNNRMDAKITATLMDTKLWDGFASGLPEKTIGTAYAIGSPTLSMWIESWNALYPNYKLYYNIVNSRGYRIGHKSGIGRYSADGNIESTTGVGSSLFYPHAEVFDHCYGYWIVSPNYSDSDNCYYYEYYTRYIGWGSMSSKFGGLRPVVCLPSSVQLTETAEGSNLYTISNKTTTE